MTTMDEHVHSHAARSEGAWDLRDRSAMAPPVRSDAEAAELRAARAYHPADLSSLDFWRATAAQREQTFAGLRAHDPVSWHQPAEAPLIADPNDQGYWAVVRHDHLIEATKRHRDFISGEGIVFESMPQELLDAAQGFIAMDPPRHTKVRRLLASAFTPKQMARTADRIQANATKVVDRLLSHDGEADFVAECATLLPMHNIFDMVGLPEDEREDASYRSQFAGGWREPELMGDGDPLTTLAQMALQLREVATRMVQDRRESPGEDLISALVRAEVDGERLTDDEIVSFFGLLSVAGNDTTRQSLSHGMAALSDHPDQRAWLLEDLEGRMPTAVEEMVRWATPIMTFRRTCAVDTELAGVPMTQGDKVVLFYSSANRDERVFADPHRFDLSRDPNPHVSFGGGGIHTCLGNSLARRQIAALYTELLTRAPDITVSGPAQPGLSNFFHVVKHLPVSWSTAA